MMNSSTSELVTVITLITGLIYYAYKLNLWISRIPRTEPVVPYQWLDDYIRTNVSNWINKYVAVDNSIPHCGGEISVENETIRISESLCKDFIVPWYNTISSGPDFPADCERAIFELLHKIFRRLSEIDPTDLAKDLLHWFHLTYQAKLRDEWLFDDENMNVFLESCTERVLKSCSPTISAQISDKDRLNGTLDPLFLMIKDLLTKAAIVPIFDIISEPEFLNKCIAKRFHILIKQESSDCHVFGEEVLENYPSPPKFTSNAIRSVSADASTNLRVPSFAPDLTSTPFKSHKRSHSQPGTNLYSTMQTISPSEIKALSPKVNDVEAACESGIDLDALPNPSSKVFRQLKIIKTEQIKTSKELYTVYVINIDALFEEIHPESIYNTDENAVASSLIWKNIVVKHRFREFVDLQISLENNPRLRPAMRKMDKSVVKPSTLKLTVLNLMSFNPLKSNVTNKPVIEHRRRCLEKYLNELCKSETISKSREFRDFLGYKEERSSFLRNPSQSILVPLGIDKVYRNVRDAITLLKPTNPQEGTYAPGPSIVVSDSPLTFLKLMKLPYGKSSKILKIINEPQFIRNLVQSTAANKELIANVGHENTVAPAIRFLNLGTRTQGDGCDDCSSNELFEVDRRFIEIPLLENILKIIKTLIPLSPLFDFLLLSVRFYLGKTLERLIRETIVRLCCTETFVHLLHNLHESIWDDDENLEWVKEEISSSSELVGKLVDRLKCNQIFSLLPYSFVERSAQSLFDSFQSKTHNKMFLILVLSSLLKRSQIGL